MKITTNAINLWSNFFSNFQNAIIKMSLARNNQKMDDNCKSLTKIVLNAKSRRISIAG